MYDRAPRSIDFTVGCTPSHVGPGSYDHRRKKLSDVGYAPFLSLSNRGDIFSSDENPGPGYYDLRNSQTISIKGGSTLANKANRFNEKFEETPGPGTYELQPTQVTRSPIPDLVKHPRQNVFRYNRRSLPPSIPDPRFAYGFEEDDAGKLVPQHPTARNDTLGPTSYDTSASVEADASKQYQGVHFAKYSSKRTDFSGKQGPGPGDYDPNNSFKLEVRHMNLKNADKRPELHVPRFLEEVLITATKESIPGPGQYSIKRELDPEPSKAEITGLEFARPGFGSQTNRFNTAPSQVPGPASYNDYSLTAFNASLTKPSSLRRIPFNQTSARFVTVDYKVRSEPGPGQYRISGFADENLRRAVVEGGKKPPFNVASVRRLDIISKEAASIPGPNSYDIKAQPFKSKYEPPSANFLSNTSRDPIIEDTPGPTAYDVPRAYQALTSQPRQPPRSINARRRHHQFLSAAKRTLPTDISNDNPGPASYDALPPSHAHGFASVHDTRFRNETSKMPGPADYELSPLFQDTVLRGTFNATLNNPVLAKLQNRALREEKAAAQTAVSAAPIEPVRGNSTAEDSMT